MAGAQTVGTTGIAVEPVELLAMALGYLDPERNYSADAGTWAEAIKGLKPEFARRYPEIFARFGFREGFESRPYSRDVSEFLTHMQLALAVGVGNPEYAVLRIDPNAQAQLLAPYTGDERYVRSLNAAQELAAALLEGHLVDAPGDASDSPPAFG